MTRRINRCIDLFEAGHPIYVTHVDGLTYESGRDHASTWADALIADFEHAPFDTVGLLAFMRGLVDGGPTPDGYRMPTVLATLPSNCRSRLEMEANAWQVRHVLSAGVHGVLHTHARCAEAVRAFVESCRYPFHQAGVGEHLGEGQRGAGGQQVPAELWGQSPRDYTEAAEPWPLVPHGELLLGLKIEDRHCVEVADEVTAVPGLGFAEWGPGDMGMSFGLPDAHDPPYPPEIDAARRTVKDACEQAGLRFLSSWNHSEQTIEQNLQELFDWGVTIVACDRAEVKEVGLRMRPRGQ